MANIDQIESFNKGTVFPSDYNETYLATKHIASSKLEIPEDILKKLKETIEKEGLYFGNDDVLKEVVTGLIKGNIILQGPPGTGKTTLAKVLCKVFNVDYDEATATSDWTTYDTIGGLQPAFDGNKEVLKGKNGCVIESILHCCNVVVANTHYNEDGANEKQASWLILDELNRCEIDKAFGDLFTVFGSDSVSENKSIRLWYENDENKKKIFLPNRFRIIGAMNNIDKNFVYDISQGLSRRFTFIEILPPEEEFFDKEVANAKQKAEKRVREKVSMLGNEAANNNFFNEIEVNNGFSTAQEGLKNLLKHIRYSKPEDDSYLGLQIGTAQIIDIFETTYIYLILDNKNNSTIKSDDFVKIFDSVVASRIIPQMDGFDYIKLSAFYSAISKRVEFAEFKKTKEAIYKFIH
jgi:5-methylcytosine-specific restriction protein B